MTNFEEIPQISYGVLQRDRYSTELEEVAEQVRRLGYGILDSGYVSEQLKEISDIFDSVREQYVKIWGETRLKDLNELHTIRALLTHGGDTFVQLAMNPNLMAVLKQLIAGTFILNQQNGIINPPRETYNQAAWHRDLPYQHFVSSTPLAVNALFCVDDFTFENGSTFVIPASHKSSAFPSESFLHRNAVQVKARAGQYILLDCMLFHSGGFNKTAKARRAVNHVFSIPYFKQQIKLPGNLRADDLTAEARALLGFSTQEPLSVADFLASRRYKMDR
jgi:ectoine hydroxylase-related dioxygenase (phytanoyl-CoA dioxygenase family)